MGFLLLSEVSCRRRGHFQSMLDICMLKRVSKGSIRSDFPWDMDEGVTASA